MPNCSWIRRRSISWMCRRFPATPLHPQIRESWDRNDTLAPMRIRSLALIMTLPASVLLLWSCLTAVPLKPRTPDTLPAQYTDAEFWRFVSEFSEPGGRFPYENFVSNEVNYQSVIPEVRRRTTPGGVYLGVAPEQNFTYIAVIQPKVSFIFDIRRQNLVELLMYKALFEMSTDRADFVSQLFSRRPPTPSPS